MQSRIADNTKVLGKKWVDLMRTKLFQLSNKLTSASGGTETFWTTVTYMKDCVLILGKGN